MSTPDLFGCTELTHVAIEPMWGSYKTWRVVVYYHGLPQRVANNLTTSQSLELAYRAQAHYKVPLHRNGLVENPVTETVVADVG